MKTVGFGIVGCGAIAETHRLAIEELAPGARVLACHDIDDGRAQAFADRSGARPVDFEALLDDPAIDVVCICTPSATHADLAVPALRAGKHVVVEKPMDISLEACDRILAAQRASGRILSVMSQNRFDDATQVLAKHVRTGVLGEVLLAECRIVWHRERSYYESSDWRGTWDIDGGGCLINQGIHSLDILQWLCGRPSVAFAVARSAVHEREVEDVIAAVVNFANGASATVIASTAGFPGVPVRLGFYGSRGHAIIEGGAIQSLAVEGQDPLGGEAPLVQAVLVATGGTKGAQRSAGVSHGSAADGWGEGHRRQLLDVLGAIDTGSHPLVDGMQGRRALDLTLGIYEAARTGETYRFTGMP